jgi:SAM-dependent methyltransferase
MSEVFGDYSRYYTLLNLGKDYGGEVEYLLRLIERHAILPERSLLDLGCGVGGHDFLLAARGYQVTGIDRSPTMLDEANRQLSSWKGPGRAPHFFAGDLTDLQLGKRFPVAISLFHVISYQTSDTALTAAFRTAAAHLEPGGLFIFDFWYGPAVLAEKPEVRVREAEDELIHIRRLAEPVQHPERRTVDVNFTIEITRKSDRLKTVLSETHEMRYLFLPELEGFLNGAGLRIVEAAEWLTDKPPSPTSWSACIVARREMSGS